MYHKDAEGRLVQAPIHEWFGLSRTNYFVLPRLAIQELPIDWQERFIALMDEAYKVHGMETPSYHVLRDDQEYTLTKRYDEDDETSRIYEYNAYRDDPWADYRRGSARELLAEKEDV